jgi:Ion channel
MAESRRTSLAQRLSVVDRIADRVGYGGVLVLIAVTYVVSAAVATATGAAVVLLFQVIALRIILRVSHARAAVMRVSAFVLWLTVAAGVILLGVGELRQHAALEETIFVLSALLYGVAPITVIRHTLTRRTVDAQTLLAAIAAYLLIGMFFAFTYRAIANVQTAPFFGSIGDGTVNDDLFFSFTTLTTTGYGNLVPAVNPGQTLAVTEMIVGQLFLVTAVAKIVNQTGVLTRIRPTGPEPEDPPTS